MDTATVAVMFTELQISHKHWLLGHPSRTFLVELINTEGTGSLEFMRCVSPSAAVRANGTINDGASFDTDTASENNLSIHAAVPGHRDRLKRACVYYSGRIGQSLTPSLLVELAQLMASDSKLLLDLGSIGDSPSRNKEVEAMKRALD